MLPEIFLITGTTNGIGKELTEFYLDSGHQVIGIDRNTNSFAKKYPKFSQIITDITDFTEVDQIINNFAIDNKLPDIFILNAGINIYDNKKFFNILDFKKCFDINFYGTFNFVSSLEKNKIFNKSIVFISSTSNIIPNPASLGYYSSKFLLKKLFPFLSNKNNYKVAILGPIKTNISREIKPPTGFAKIIYNMLIVDAKPMCINLEKFINSNKEIFYYTKKSIIFYYIIKIILIFFPFLYIGGKTK